MKQTLFEKIKRALILWLARRLPDCKTITPKLGESIDRKLSLKSRLVLRLHLMTCDACARYLKQIKYLSEALHSQEERLEGSADDSQPKLSGEFKERLKEQLRAATGQAL